MRTELRFSDSPTDKAKSPFVLGREQRPLRLVLDDAHLVDDALRKLLEGFAWHDDVWVASSRPGSRNELTFGAEHDDDLPVFLTHANGTRQTSVPFVHQWDHFADKPTLRDGLALPPGPWSSRNYRRDQYLLRQAAESLRADVVVTDDRFLLEFQRPSTRGPTVLASREALALIGSHLRNRGDFTLWSDEHHRSRFSRGLFYWVLARDLLPGGWRWFSAAVASDRATDGDLMSLAGSALTRCQQALKARDHVHWQIFRPHNNDTADDALFYLDMLLISLAGAFDVIARVADIALHLGNARAQVSWNNDRWRHALRAKDRALDAVMKPGSEHALVHTAVSSLRNSIHGEALSTVAYQNASKPIENMLVLPVAERQRLTQVVDQLGGRASWGYEDLGGRHTCVRPAMLVEALLPRVFRAVNDIMVATPVERLAGVSAHSQLMTGAPEDDEVWGLETRRLVRTLAGI